MYSSLAGLFTSLGSLPSEVFINGRKALQYIILWHKWHGNFVIRTYEMIDS